MIADLVALPGRLRMLLVGVLVTGVTTFMLVPLLAVHLTRTGMSVLQAGVVIGVLTVAQQGSALVIGVGVDLWGADRFIRGGVLLRVAGYAGLLWAGSFWLTAGSAALIGLGGAMLSLGIRAELGSVPAPDRRGVLAIRGSFVNIGAMVGPPLGGLALGFGFGTVLLCAMASHAVLLLLLRSAAPGRPATTGQPRPALPPWRVVLVSPAVLAVTAAAALFWLLYSQITITVPIFVTARTGTELTITWLFAINGLLVVLLQHPLLKHVFHRWSPAAVISLGLLAFGAGYAALGPAHGWVLLLAYLLAFTLGEMLLGPTLDEAVLQAAPAEVRGSALGMVSMGAAAGSLLGTTAGAAAFDQLDQAYWWLLAAVAAVAGLAAAALARTRRTVPAEAT